MSAKDAPGEVNNKNLFDSPNISAAEEEKVKPEVDKEAEERKKRETVDIDGVPIDDKDIKYKAADIRKKGRMNYFIHVTDASKYEKQAERRKAQAKRAAEHMAAEEKREAEREEKEAAAAAIKKQVEEKKHIDEVNTYVMQQKKAKAKEEKKEEREEKRADRRPNGRRDSHKKIITGAIIAGVLIIAGVVTVIILNKTGVIGGGEDPYVAEYMAYPAHAIIAELDKNEELKSALDNYQYYLIDQIYDDSLKGASDETKAEVYLNMADRIAKRNATEHEAIIAAIEKARACDPENIYVLTRLRDEYMIADDYDKMREIDRLIKSISAKEDKEVGEEEQGQG